MNGKLFWTIIQCLTVLSIFCEIAYCDPWTAIECTITKNDCKKEDNSTCIWWLPDCRLPGAKIACTAADLDPTHCCEVDECGDLFQALVMVQLHNPQKTNTTVYNTLRGGAVSPKADVNAFLSKYPEGTTQTCYYQKGPLNSILDKDLICHSKGSLDIATGTCNCHKGYKGEFCESKDEVFTPGVVRRYYILAEEFIWDYAPSGIDNVTQMDLMASVRPMHNPQTWVENDPSRNMIGKVYKKARYVQFSDEEFTTPLVRAPQWTHLGLLGPVIRANVGETIKIVFRNNATRAYSMHPHGVMYTKPNEGAAYAGESPQDGNLVLPGDTYTYTWTVPERAGPGPNDPSSVVWFYHSHVDEGQDTNTGLVGPIIICRKGEGDANAKPKDIDREFVTFYSIYDETRSWYLRENIITYLNKSNNFTSMDVMRLQMDKDFIFNSFKHSINGYLYGNIPGVTMELNERVRWYVMSLGTENDIHGAHWHGSTLLYQGSRVDSIEMIPGTTKALDMVPDTEGTWLFHCHTNHHIHGGMTGLFYVKPCSKKGGCGAAAVGKIVSPTLEAPLPMWPFIIASVLVTVFVVVGLGMVWWLRKRRNQSTYHSVELSE